LPWVHWRFCAVAVEEAHDILFRFQEQGGTLHPSFIRPVDEKDMTYGLPFPPSMPEWLKNLPLPCGIMTDCEDMARAILFCAAFLHLRIPDDLALITAALSKSALKKRFGGRSWKPSSKPICRKPCASCGKPT
jgi:hypothetical protein